LKENNSWVPRGEDVPTKITEKPYKGKTLKNELGRPPDLSTEGRGKKNTTKKKEQSGSCRSPRKNHGEIRYEDKPRFNHQEGEISK